MAGEQLMLVDGQPQTIVVDQQQITAYQQANPQQQFIVQETNAEPQQQQQQQQQLQNSQVFFMSDSNTQENGEAACDTPIVLNHHMQPGQLRAQIVGNKVVAAQHLAQQQARASQGVRQLLQVRVSDVYFCVKRRLCFVLF